MASSCPSCASTATQSLEHLTRNDNVEYHRCEACGHIWVTFKDGRPTHHVTALSVKAS
jgi:uncharacterized Zn finger protein